MFTPVARAKAIETNKPLRRVSTKIQSVIKFLNVSENTEIGAFQIYTEIDFESEVK